MKNKNKNKNYLFLGDNQKIRKKLAFSLLAVLIGVFLLPSAVLAININPENIIDLTNELRVSSKLNKLTANQLLAKAAYNKGHEILEAQDFQHNIDGRKFSSWVKEAGYNYAYTGENLAIDFITAQGVLGAWQNSPTHNKNLLNPNYTEIGVAVIEGQFKGKNTILVVQIFGTPARVDIGANAINTDISSNSWQIANNQSARDLSLTVINNTNTEDLITNAASGNITYHGNSFESDKNIKDQLALLKTKVNNIDPANTVLSLNIKSLFTKPSANSLLSVAVFVFLVYLLFLYAYYFNKMIDLSKQLKLDQKQKNQ